jgi:hypothetical protein
MSLHRVGVKLTLIMHQNLRCVKAGQAHTSLTKILNVLGCGVPQDIIDKIHHLKNDGRAHHSMRYLSDRCLALHLFVSSRHHSRPFIVAKNFAKFSGYKWVHYLAL